MQDNTALSVDLGMNISGIPKTAELSGSFSFFRLDCRWFQTDQKSFIKVLHQVTARVHPLHPVLIAFSTAGFEIGITQNCVYRAKMWCAGECLADPRGWLSTQINWEQVIFTRKQSGGVYNSQGPKLSVRCKLRSLLIVVACRLQWLPRKRNGYTYISSPALLEQNSKIILCLLNAKRPAIFKESVQFEGIHFSN